jgi:CDP-glycerol glycerophosphotransferase (TagB/SpsB family)
MKRFWSKNPSRYLHLQSQLRAVAIHWPMSVIFHIAEFLFRNRAKTLVLFLLPYKEYCENTRHLFEYCLQRKNESHSATLFVYDRELYVRLRARYRDSVVFARSLAGVRAFFSSRLCFTSRGSIVTVFRPFVFLPRWKTVINLWHGIPLKRLGAQARDTWERKVSLELQPFHAMVVCSKFEQLAMAACYGFNLDRLWITNVPRNDPLFTAKLASRPRTVLYAPTWRDGAADARFFPFPDVDLDALERVLEKNDCRMVLRPHLVERAETVQAFGGRRYIVVDDSGPLSSVTETLLDTRVLITDYSSIYLDFLALDRPILFVPYDLAEYDKRRGFMLEYERATPGPKVTTFATFLAELELSLTSPTRYAEERASALAFFHEHQDGDACSRILDHAIRSANGNSRPYESPMVGTPASAAP